MNNESEVKMQQNTLYRVGDSWFKFDNNLLHILKMKEKYFTARKNYADAKLIRFQRSEDAFAKYFVMPN